MNKLIAALKQIAAQLRAIALSLDDIRIELKKKRYDDAEWRSNHAGAD